MILALSLALLAQAPAEAGLDRAPLSRGSVIRGLSPNAAPAPNPTEGCRRVAQFAELPKPPAASPRQGVTPPTQLPDADLIRAVLRSVDGVCEIVVVRQGVSDKAD